MFHVDLVEKGWEKIFGPQVGGCAALVSMLLFRGRTSLVV
jgi:hypothetical protein